MELNKLKFGISAKLIVRSVAEWLDPSSRALSLRLDFVEDELELGQVFLGVLPFSRALNFIPPWAARRVN